MLGPKYYRFGHIGPDLVYGDDIHKCFWNIYKQIKWVLGSLP
jgi:hypothetical protein